jgi:hypothetical protein
MPFPHMGARVFKRRRKASKRAIRRLTVLWQRAALSAGIFICIGAFAAGFFTNREAREVGGSRDDRRPAKSPVVDFADRAEALQLMNEAVKARYVARFFEAANAALAARSADETLPGIDAFLAEMAFQEGESDVVERAALAALRRRESESSAHLLLALNAWRTRVQRMKSTAEAGDEAGRLLADASAAQMSDEAVWFFWGELMRLVGREDQAHRRLLGAMHRVMPWRSADFLTTKLQLSDEDAAELGSLDADLGRSLRALRGSGDREADEVLAARQNFSAYASSKVITWLAAEGRLASVPWELSFQPQLVPHAEVAPPVANDSEPGEFQVPSLWIQ